MMKKILLFLLALFNFCTYAQSFQWVNSVGDSGIYHGVRGNSIKTDGLGNSYITGYFTDTTDFDGGPGVFNLLTPKNTSNVFVLKLNSSGDFVWAKNMNGSSGVGLSLAIDPSGNIYTTGTFGGVVDFDPGPGTYTISESTPGAVNTFISKLDPSGNFVWAKSIGGMGDTYGRGISTDNAGNAYITGSFSDTLDLDPGPGLNKLISNGDADIFILKLDPLGNFVWAKSIGGNTIDEGVSIMTDATGNNYTTGSFSGTSDFNPGINSYSLSPVGLNDIFILKLNASGNFVWAKAMGGDLGDGGQSITTDEFGNLYTTGYFSDVVDFNASAGVDTLTAYGTWDVFVLKLDTAGNYKWAKKLGGPGNETGNGICTDFHGNVYTTGRYALSSDFDPGINSFVLDNSGNAHTTIFISELDSSGNFVNAFSLGSPGSNNCEGMSIHSDLSGNIYTTGYYSGLVNFDPVTASYPLTAKGNYDLFVHKMGPPVITSMQAITKNNEAALIIYPNPNNGVFTIASKEKMSLQIIDELGQLIQCVELTEANHFQQTIDLLNSGMYFISGQSPDLPVKEKIIIAR